MGTTCSSGHSEGTDFQTFIADYIPLRKEKDTHYGEVTLLEHKSTHEIVALKELLSKSSSDFKHDIQGFNNRLALQHPNIIRLISFNSRSEDRLCSSFYRIQVIIEYNNTDLDKEISERAKNQEKYTEEQLWYLTECVLEALETLQQRETYHGDIKPGNIFISRLGNYKIAEQDLVAGVPTYAQRVTGVSDVHGYLSPELLRALDRRELKPRHDFHKSDVFSLGMTILQAATLTSGDDLYDWEKNVLRSQELNERVASIGQNYSLELLKIVESMLAPEEGQRPSATDLLKLVPRKRSEVIQIAGGIQVEGPKHSGADKKVESGAPNEEQPLLNGDVAVNQGQPVQKAEKPVDQNATLQETKLEEVGQVGLNLGTQSQSNYSAGQNDPQKSDQPKQSSGQERPSTYTVKANLNLGGPQTTYSKPETTNLPQQGEVSAKPAYQYGSYRTQNQPVSSQPADAKTTVASNYQPNKSYQPLSSGAKQPTATAGTNLYQPGAITATTNVSNPVNKFGSVPLTKPAELPNPTQQPSTYQPLSKTGTTSVEQPEKGQAGVSTKPNTTSAQPTASKYQSAYILGAASNTQGGLPTAATTGEQKGPTTYQPLNKTTPVTGEQPEKVQVSVTTKPTTTSGLLNSPAQITSTDQPTTNVRPQQSSYASSYQPKSQQLATSSGRPTATQRDSSNLPADVNQPNSTSTQQTTTVSQPTTNLSQQSATTYTQPTAKYQPVSTTQPVLQTIQPTSYLSRPISAATQPSTTAGQSSSLTTQPATNLTQPVSTQGQPATTPVKYGSRYQPSNTSSNPYTGYQSASPANQNQLNLNQDSKPTEDFVTESFNMQSKPGNSQIREEAPQAFAKRPAEFQKRSDYPGASGSDRTNPYLSKPVESQASVATTELPKREERAYKPNPSDNLSSGQTAASYLKPTYSAKAQESLGQTEKPYSGNLPLQTKNDYSIDRPPRTQDYSNLSSNSKPLDSQLGVTIDPYKSENERSFGNYRITDPYTAGRPENQQFDQTPDKSFNRYDLLAPNQILPNGDQLEFVTETYADGSIYEGEKKGALRHGRGRFYYSDGGLYDGDWKEGAMHGIGTLYYGNGQIAYEGEWLEDQFHGRGIVHNENPVPLVGEYDYKNFDNLEDFWVKYDGDFVNDSKEGLGILYLSNGDRFEGEFRGDMIHGVGTYFFLNGKQVTGEWWNNRLL